MNPETLFRNSCQALDESPAERIPHAGAVSIYFAWYTGLLVMEAYEYNDLSSGMIPVPLWIPQSGMLVGLIVLSIALIDELFGLCSGANPSYHNKGENLLEDKEPIPTSILDGE